MIMKLVYPTVAPGLSSNFYLISHRQHGALRLLRLGSFLPRRCWILRLKAKSGHFIAQPLIGVSVIRPGVASPNHVLAIGDLGPVSGEHRPIGHALVIGGVYNGKGHGGKKYCGFT